MKKLLILVVLGVSAVSGAAVLAAELLTSPDHKTTVRIQTDKQIRYSITVDNVEVLLPSEISMTVVGKGTLGNKGRVVSVHRQSVDEELVPVVPTKSNVVRNHYNELTLTFDGDFGVIFRAYDDAVAYRFFTTFDKQIKVGSEQAEFVFGGDYKLYRSGIPNSNDFHSSQETHYSPMKISQFGSWAIAYPPLLVEIPDGPKLVITEADLDEYPGMWLKKHPRRAGALTAVFPGYPAAEKRQGDRHVKVTKRADFIAKTKGTRKFPWRVIAIAEKDGRLIESPIVWKLGPELKLADTSWIRPGKVAWDWWNALNIYGVDFGAGINTKTYKYYIDFAAQYGIEYIILDEGWSDSQDLLKISPDVDLHELIRYGKQKGVGLILWCVWRTLDEQMERVLPAFEKWGVAGLKVDFMDRDDQKMVEFYHRCAAETGRHHLLLDFHGAYKPTGLERAYPNLLTREGVLGLEYCKWSKQCDPEHAVTIPFTRMVAGPMDFTPGAMNNAQKENFRDVFNRPMSQGTRCHQLAMYVVYESPLQMLCDSPSNYMRNACCMQFLSKVPVTWDQTKVLDAKVADYVVVARRKGKTWYLGAMTDWTAREFELDLSFLSEGKYDADIIADGPNADRIGIDHAHKEKQVTRKTKMNIKLAPGGGFVAVFEPAQ